MAQPSDGTFINHYRGMVAVEILQQRRKFYYVATKDTGLCVHSDGINVKAAWAQDLLVDN